MVVTDPSEVVAFMAGKVDMLVFADFTKSDPVVILKSRSLSFLNCYYILKLRYLGVAKFEQSKSSVVPGSPFPNFHGVLGAICVSVDNRFPFSLKTVTLATFAVSICVSALLWTFCYLELRIGLPRAFLVFLLTLGLGFIVTLYINGFLEVSSSV